MPLTHVPSSRRRALALPLAIALAFGAAGCGDDDDGAGDAASDAASEDAGSADDASATTDVTQEAAPMDGETCAQPADVPEAEGKPEVEMPDEIPGELVIDDIREGDGPAARLGDTIEVHYVGLSCSTGEQFDASYDRGEPIAFGLVEGGLIEGWTEGIPGMKVGGQRRLVIPADLAYGDNPPSRSGIAPGETLVFVIDLLGVS